MYVTNLTAFPPRPSKPAPRFTAAVLAAIRAVLADPATGPKFRSVCAEMDRAVRTVPDAVLAAVAVEVAASLLAEAVDRFADKLIQRVEA